MATDKTALPSIKALHKYGVPRSTAIYVVQNHWHIDSYRHLLQRYFLLHWETDYFIRKLQDGRIEKDGILYSVFYYQCTPVSISKHRIKLSFRELHEEYAVEPTVLVTLA